MDGKIRVTTLDEFNEFIQGNNLELSQLIIEKITDGIANDLPEVRVLEVLLEKGIMDLSIKQEDWLDALEKNLIIHENFEEYEKCIHIKNMIRLLQT